MAKNNQKKEHVMSAAVKKKVQDIQEKLKKCKKDDDEDDLRRIERRVLEGQLLRELKAAFEHGDWLPALSETRYDIRTAQRLMNLPGSAVDQLRTADPRLAIKLPGDVQKLSELAKLSLDQLREALADGGWYEEDWSRTQVADTVKNVKAGKPAVVAENIDDDESDDDTDDDKGSKPLRGTQQGVARQQSRRADADEGDAADDAAVEDHDDGAAAEGDAGEEQAKANADSPLDHAINEAAQAIYDLAVSDARESARRPNFRALAGQGRTEDDLVHAILHRVYELIAAGTEC
jgi:hypothetical protein